MTAAGGVLLGVDIGTSSSKGVAVDARGAVLATATRPHAVSTPRPGWVEHDAETVWWADFTAITRELLDAVGARPDGSSDHGPLLALAVSGIGPVALPADGAGTPLRPAILYGVDTRATTQIADLTRELGADAILARGGAALSSQAVGPKLRWLAEHEPDVWRRTELLLMASSLVVLRLTGRYVLDHHSASQCDPLYDLRAADWARDWADVVAPGLALPELAWPSEVVGTVTIGAARATGLPAGLPVTAGTVDAWAEAASVGVRDPGDTMVMYGTTMFLVQVAGEPEPHPALWATRGVTPGSYSLAAGMATSGAVTDWLRGLVGGDFATLVREAAAVPAGSRGLLVLPYFAGERTPILDPDARGVIAGLTLAHGRAELYRATLEGVAYGVRHNLDVMADAAPGTAAGSDGGSGRAGRAGRAGRSGRSGGSGRSGAAARPARRLVAVGGGAQGSLWTQIVSDVTRAEQTVPRHTVGACLGDAVLAATAIGLDVDMDTWNPPAVTVRPDPARADLYDGFSQRYRELYPATRDVQHFLAAAQHAAADTTAAAD